MGACVRPFRAFGPFLGSESLACLLVVLSGANLSSFAEQIHYFGSRQEYVVGEQGLS